MERPSESSANMCASAPPAKTLTWRARGGWKPVDVVELWQFRDLLWILALRDIQLRYKQTVLGVVWCILQPLLTTGVFTFIFGLLAGLPSSGRPYAVFAYSSILVYMLFSRCLSASTLSLAGNQHLLTKVYFPRLIYPLAPALSNVLDFFVGCLFLVALLVIYRVTPGWQVFAAPFFVFLAVTFGFSLGLWLGALNVRYRDVGALLPLLTQLWMYVTPVVYPLDLVTARWPQLYLPLALNPVTGIVEGFRWAVLGESGSAPLLLFGVSTLVTGLLLVGGLLFFHRMEDTFADVV